MIVGPPRRWIAPSTPPPPASRLLAALTIASTSSKVMSPTDSSNTREPICRFMGHFPSNILHFRDGTLEASCCELAEVLMRRSYFILFALVSSIPAASARDIYVDNVAGDDKFDGNVPLATTSVDGP